MYASVNESASGLQISQLCKDSWDALDDSEQRMYERQAASLINKQVQDVYQTHFSQDIEHICEIHDDGARRDDMAKEAEAQEYDEIAKTRSLKKSISMQSEFVDCDLLGDEDQVVGC
jgi:hypothetical protein